jgi:peptide/nickel transport system permease protein
MSRLPSWTGWFLTRCLLGFTTVLSLSAIVFVATQALPSDPARVILGPEATDAAIETLRRQLGLDLPLWQQYARWLWQLLHGELGLSLSSRVPVSQLIGERIWGTLTLVSLVIVIGTLVAVALGVVLAVRRDSRFDRAVVTSLIAVKAVPGFAIGIAFVMLFSTSVFHVLPAVSLLDTRRSTFSQLDLLVLPFLTLLVSSVPYLARLVRASMIEALSSDYVREARLRGIPELRVIFRHALPNALIPVVQGIALTASVLLGGSLIVEVLFNYPGLGSLLNQAVEGRDLPIVQAAVLVVATGVVATNLTADLLTIVLTPKLRTATAQGRAVSASSATPLSSEATRPATAQSSP